MQLDKKTAITFSLFAALLFAPNVFAEETSTASDVQNESQASISQEDLTAATAVANQQAAQAVAADEAVDLNVGEPSLLPDSPFYFLKNWARGIQTFFSFDPAKKAELKLKFSSEKMAEAKKLLEQNKTDKAMEAIKDSTTDMEKAKAVISQLKNSSTTDQVLEKMAQKTVTYQKLLNALQENIPAEKQQAFAVLKETIINSYLSAENPEKIQERLQKVLADQQGSDFKEVKNMQILEEIKNAAPENIKQKIENASGNEAAILENKLGSLSAEKIEALKPYLEQLNGSEGLIVSLLNKFQNQNISTSSLEKIEQAENKIMQRMKDKATPEKINSLLSEAEKTLTQWESKINENKSLFTDAEYQKMMETIALAKKEIEKAKTAISEGKLGEAFGQAAAIKVQIENIAKTYKKAELKNEKGTATTSDRVYCPAIWDPVCAEDGKTYSNECVVENIKKMEIKYKGECKKETAKDQAINNSISDSAGVANPASVYCTKLGYKLEIRTEANGGQYGVCIFGDGQECEEWKFYRKECGNEYVKTNSSTTNNSAVNSLSPAD
ncbi:MAG: DUF333 domain-containing protein [Candidatus Paceibacterota bacterium]|jgi:putative hemolysin